VAQVKFENQTEAISSQIIYTAGAQNAILQVNFYSETIEGTGSVEVGIAYTSGVGQKMLSPTTDYNPYTIKVLAGTSISLSVNMLSVSKYNVYVVVTDLWDL